MHSMIENIIQGNESTHQIKSVLSGFNRPVRWSQELHRDECCDPDCHSIYPFVLPGAEAGVQRDSCVDGCEGTGMEESLQEAFLSGGIQG